MEQHMMDVEKLRQYLSNIYENYHIDIQSGVHITYVAKCLGAMEAILVVLGVLSPGVPFVYENKERTFHLFWIFPFKYTSKETYKELILRLTAETLSK